MVLRDRAEFNSDGTIDRKSRLSEEIKNSLNEATSGCSQVVDWLNQIEKDLEDGGDLNISRGRQGGSTTSRISHASSDVESSVGAEANHAGGGAKDHYIWVLRGSVLWAPGKALSEGWSDASHHSMRGPSSFKTIGGVPFPYEELKRRKDPILQLWHVLHPGWRDRILQDVDQIKAVLKTFFQISKKEIVLTLTGHSMGAGMAIVLAIFLLHRSAIFDIPEKDFNRLSVRVIVFGAPVVFQWNPKFLQNAPRFFPTSSGSPVAPPRETRSDETTNIDSFPNASYNRSLTRLYDEFGKLSKNALKMFFRKEDMISRIAAARSKDDLVRPFEGCRSSSSSSCISECALTTCAAGLLCANNLVCRPSVGPRQPKFLYTCLHAPGRSVLIPGNGKTDAPQLAEFDLRVSVGAVSLAEIWPKTVTSFFAGVLSLEKQHGLNQQNWVPFGTGGTRRFAEDVVPQAC